MNETLNREFATWKKMIVDAIASDVDIFDLAYVVQACNGCPAEETTCLGGKGCSQALREHFAYAQADEVYLETVL